MLFSFLVDKSNINIYRPGIVDEVLIMQSTLSKNSMHNRKKPFQVEEGKTRAVER